MAGAQSREDVRQILAVAKPDDSVGKRNNNSSQLWGLKSVQLRDIVIMPMKTTKTLAIGRATSGYEYHDNPDPPFGMWSGSTGSGTTSLAQRRDDDREP